MKFSLTKLNLEWKKIFSVQLLTHPPEVVLLLLDVDYLHTDSLPRLADGDLVEASLRHDDTEQFEQIQRLLVESRTLSERRSSAGHELQVLHHPVHSSRTRINVEQSLQIKSLALLHLLLLPGNIVDDWLENVELTWLSDWRRSGESCTQSRQTWRHEWIESS